MTSLEDSDTPEARARAARQALIGMTLANRYTLRGLVGHGGMGAVYEAEHLGLGRRVAVKLVDPEFATEERVLSRFAREARAMSSIESPHIVTVLDAGTENGRPFLVMELLRGEDLGQRLRRLQKIPVGEALHIVAQVLKGLAKAHAAGIVHRDLKPDNVFLILRDADPLFAKIVDFGVSKIERPRDKTSPLALTGRGTILGTPFYMSPEQAQAVPDIDVRADLYSVGAILFECLTGRPPHTGETYEQVMLSICMRDAPDLRSIDPSIPVDVARFVARALSRDRSRRLGSANRMLAAVHDLAPEEKRRVPLDVSAATLLSEGVADGTEADAPVKGAATGLHGSAAVPSTDTRGVATLPSPGNGYDGGRTTPHGSAIAVSASVPHPRVKPPNATALSPGEKRARELETGSSSVSIPGVPRHRKRSSTTVVVTAALALVTGVAVMFGLITILGRKVDSTVTAASTTSSSHATPPTITSGMTKASASAESSATPSSALRVSALPPPSAAEATKANAPPTTKHVTPGRSGGPKPGASQLDIARDLP
jgi:eukaryotic-like serine/threonine-protein kinase